LTNIIFNWKDVDSNKISKLTNLIDEKNIDFVFEEKSKNTKDRGIIIGYSSGIGGGYFLEDYGKPRKNSKRYQEWVEFEKTIKDIFLKILSNKENK